MVKRMPPKKVPTYYGGIHQFENYWDAMAMAGDWVMQGGRPIVEVIIRSPAGAKWWGGEFALEDYLERPDAPALYQIEMTGKDLQKPKPKKKKKSGRRR